MSFLAPLFLLGGAAILGPILFHLIRRTTREVTPFSTLMFLEPTPPRVTKRSRLENLWLLLLRCLAILLLAMAFARPFFMRPASSLPLGEGAGKRTVILVDLSASMRRENLWAAAKERAESLARQAAPEDELAVLAFDGTTRSVLSFEEWRSTPVEGRAAAVAGRLGALSPGWGRTQLDAAMLRAADLLDQTAKDGPHPRTLVVISDLQEGSRIDGLQGFEWPRGLEVEFETIEAKELANAALQWLPEGEEGSSTAETAPLRIRASNAAEAKKEQFTLTWGNSRLEAYVPAGQSRVVTPPAAPGDPAAPLTLSGDEVDFDNRLFFAAPQPVALPIVFAGADGEEDARGSLYYVRRAFPKTRRQRVEIVAHRGADAIPAFQLQQAQLLILSDAASDATVGTARQFAATGRTVVLPLTSAAGGTTLGRLLERNDLRVTEAALKDYALLAQIDFQHPLFAPFADPRFSDFTKIHFWKHRRIDLASEPHARIAARFDSGDAAIVQFPLGRGQLIVFTSSWRPSDSQLALSSKFVPLLGAILEQSSQLPAQKAQYFVGDEILLPPSEAGWTIRPPEGAEVKVANRFADTTTPGIYTVNPGGQPVVVNLAPEESRLAPLARDRLVALGVPLRQSQPTAASPDPQREAQAQAAEVESRQKLWRWLLAAALLVLLLETLIAGRLSRSPVVPNAVTP